ncbi:MAG: nitroreductase family protein [bacterium]
MKKVFKRRHSVRRFQRKEIEEKDLEKILEAAESAPSAGDLKARKIIVVKDLDLKKEIVEAALNQNFIGDAPVVLVFVALPSISAIKYGMRGRNLYAIQDATIAASFAWIQAVTFGIDSCWVGAFNESEIKKILKLRGDEQPIAILPLGYKK